MHFERETQICRIRYFGSCRALQIDGWRQYNLWRITRSARSCSGIEIHGTSTWWFDNVGAEQLERTEKARYEGEISSDTAARQRTSYTTRSSLTTRDARCDYECDFDASYQIYFAAVHFTIVYVYIEILCTCDSSSNEIQFLFYPLKKNVFIKFIFER